MREVELIESILSELKKIQSNPFPKTELGMSPRLPSLISAGDGGSLILNDNIDKHIQDLSSGLYDKAQSWHESMSFKDFHGLIRRSLGPLLAKIDLEHDPKTSAQIVQEQLNLEMANSDWNFHAKTYLLGCSFSYTEKIPKLEIGPVSIWHRDDWLEHALRDAIISQITYRRLKKTWSGQKVRKRKPGRDDSNEYYILDSVGKSQYICAVHVTGQFGHFATSKAIMAARLSLLSMALIWARPSKTLQSVSLLYDGPPHRKTYSFYQDERDILSGSRWANDMHGAIFFSSTWKAMAEKSRPIHATLSEVLNYYLSSGIGNARPKMMSCLLQALLWFHEACREESDMIATTKFVACLDALVLGRHEHAILQMVCKFLGVLPETTLRKGGPTCKKAIEDLYSNGRSRPIHGTTDKFGFDWEYRRDLAEILARDCLVCCLVWTNENPNCDEPKEMVKPVA